MKLKLRQKTPAFCLPDQDGSLHAPRLYLGKWLLIYFYPKDDTPGCTKEACSIGDNFPAFKRLRLAVLGISTDSVKSHKKFAEKYKLPFTLLADEKKEAVRKYGVYGKKKFMGREYMGTMRTSFLIDPRGKIAKIYEKVNPVLHAEEVLADMKTFKKAK